MNWKKLVILLSLVGCFGLFLVVIIEKGTVFIGPDERGVVLSYGAPAGYPKVLTPGRYWLLPGERAMVYTISPETYTTLSKTLGSDAIRARLSEGDDVLVHVSATYSINPERVLDLYISWQDRYKDGLVRPLVRGTTRKILSKHTANEIKVNHANIERLIFEMLERELGKNHLILFDFKITDVQPYDD